MMLGSSYLELWSLSESRVASDESVRQESMEKVEMSRLRPDVSREMTGKMPDGRSFSLEIDRRETFSMLMLTRDTVVGETSDGLCFLLSIARRMRKWSERR